MSRDLIRRIEQLEAARPAAAEPLPRGAALAGLVGLDLDPWQREVLETEASQLVLCCARQSGKSTVTALAAVDTTIHGRGSLVLMLAPSQRQAGELFRKSKAVLGALGDRALALVQESALSLELANGSRIVSLPGKEQSIRGYSAVSLLIVDEAARVSDDLYMSIRPMLAVSGGRVNLLSTPRGARGFFHAEVTSTDPGWFRMTVAASECPRISPAWLAVEREKIGEYWYRQEYNCEFVDTEMQVFASDWIDAAVDATIRPLFDLTHTADAA